MAIDGNVFDTAYNDIAGIESKSDGGSSLRLVEHDNSR